MRVEKIIASASITQDSYRLRHKVDAQIGSQSESLAESRSSGKSSSSTSGKDSSHGSEGASSPNEIDIEVYPGKDQTNIARINGSYQGFQCMVDQDELHGLPMRLAGIGGNLADKLSFHLKGQVDKKGKFNVFVTGLATTMVQFKLWGNLFPGVERPVDNINPEIFRDEVFRRLKRYQKSDVPGLREWVTGMTTFWDKWHGVFQLDLQTDLIRRLNDLRNDFQDQIDKQQEQIIALRKENIDLRQETSDLRLQVRQTAQSLNSTRSSSVFANYP